MKAESYRRKLRKKICRLRAYSGYSKSFYLQGRAHGLATALEWFKDVPL
jgi:hypothetical protein